MEANHFGERYSFQWQVFLSVEAIPVNRTHSFEWNPEKFCYNSHCKVFISRNYQKLFERRYKLNLVPLIYLI